LSVHKNGQVAIVQTNGNKRLPRHPARRQGAELRRGQRRSFAGASDLEAVQAAAHTDGRLQPRQQFSKQHQKQIDVAKDIAGSDRREGRTACSA
jgi:3-deoxy-7-phosphoheptulonate synthase